MGLIMSCFSGQAMEATGGNAKRRRPPPPPPGASRRRNSVRLRDDEAAAIQELAQAAAAAIIQQQQQNGGLGMAPPFDRSTSLRYQKKQSGNGGDLPRSMSTRPRLAGDPVVQPQQLLNQDLKADELETNIIVLVHGGGFGAWCWYKSISLLEDSGFKVHAIDLTGSGVHSSDTNKITSLSEYVKPLTTFLESLPENQKVILVGHDFGGACISHAMEMFPKRVAKAIFVCAAMLTSGHSTLELFSEQMDANGLLHSTQKFVYSNGQDQPPTAISLDKALIKELLFNQSPSKDVSLASVSMRPIPFAPVLEKLSLTEKNYGSVRRFYIETTDDNTIPLSSQQKMCESNPPEKVFRLKSSDHSPFFSKPQALHKLLVEIAKMPPLPTT
ncbi:putative methylesterase 11, chloroplastic isoform X2 [Carex rostrata]